MISIIIIIGVAVSRFTTRDLRYMFILRLFSKWLVLGALHTILAFAERETRDKEALA